MKFSVSIPLTTVFVLFLTLGINVIGLKYSLEKHFPEYVESKQSALEKNIAINADNIKALFSVRSLDSEAQAEYSKALTELSNISSSLESLSKNPELYVDKNSSGASSPDAFRIFATTPEILENYTQKSLDTGILSVFSHPFSSDQNSPEAKFSWKIIQNFLLLNAIWLLIIIFFYIIWIRKIFKPIHLIIDSLKNFSTDKDSLGLSYEKRDEFRPLIRTLNELHTSLGQQENIRNQFLSDLSHEIRTPMTAISCLLEAIDDGIMPFDKSTILTLQGEMRRLVDITEHIMKSENFLSETEKIRKEIFSLQKIFQEISLQYQPKFQKNNQDIFEKFQRKDVIFANKEQFIQILHNIFSNFSKYA